MINLCPSFLKKRIQLVNRDVVLFRLVNTFNKIFFSAYQRLKEKLPNYTNIKSKKEIIVQVNKNNNDFYLCSIFSGHLTHSRIEV